MSVPTPVPPPIPSNPGSLDLLDAILEARARLGLPAPTPHAELDRVAAWWAGEMARNQFLTHGDAASRIASVLRVSASGETIAMGQRTAKDVVADWLGSPGHRAILTGDYNLVGTGAAADANGLIYWCGDFAKP